MVRRTLALASCWLLLGAVGCAMDLPLLERIADTRPLALRVEVVEAAADPDAAVRAEALPIDLGNPFDPFSTIRVRPFFVDPDGPLTADRVEQELAPVWLACPMQPFDGVFSCLSRQLPLELDQIEDCPTLTVADLDPTALMLPPVPTPCRMQGGTPSEPSMQVPLSFELFLGGDLEVTFIASRSPDVTTERCAQAVLQLEPLPEECLVGSQRAPVGPDSEILRLAEGLGIPGLDQLGDLPLDEDGNVIEVEPDRHPRIQTFRVVVTDEEITRTNLEEAFDGGQAIDVARGDTVSVRVGQTLVIETTAPEDDLQTYLIPRDTMGFEERTENYDGDWYRTWGTLLSINSDDPRSLNTWVMEPGEQDAIDEALPPDGRATMYYVLADDRQGVDWWWFHVAVSAG